MTTTTTVRSWSAIGVGVFFSGVTAFVLMDDVVRHGAPFTTRHVMTLAVLAGTVYFGHTFWREARGLRLGNALGCAVLFAAGTLVCVLMSAGRNAEAVTTKVMAANAVNSEREWARTDRDEAKARYQAAMDAETTECASGSGPKCTAKRKTTELRRLDLEAAEIVLREQKPEQVANADVAAAAALIARLPYVTADAKAIEALLLLAFPFLLSLFCEIGAIVGFSIGLGHKVEPLPPARQLPAPAAVSPIKLRPVKEAPVRGARDEAAEVVSALKRAGRPVNNDELAGLMGVTKAESSKRVTALNGHKVRRVRRGREVEITLAR